MKKNKLCSLLSIIILTCLAACSSNDDGASTSSTLSTSDTKAAVKVAETTFYGSFSRTEFAQFDSLLTYFRQTYGGYTRQNDTTVVPLALLSSNLSKILNGNLTAVTSLLSSIRTVRGEYQANATTRQWDRVSAAADTVNHLVLHFSDKAGKACIATFAWDFIKADGSVAQPIHLSDAYETVSITLPPHITFNVKDDGQNVVDLDSHFSYAATTSTLTGTIALSLGNYTSDATLTFNNQKLSVAATLNRGSVRLLSAIMNVNGDNMISHFINQSTVQTIQNSDITIQLPNNVSAIINVKSPAIARLALLKVVTGSPSTEDIQSFAQTVNTSVTRILRVGTTDAATLTFTARQNPTQATLLGRLQTRVTYADGQTGNMEELFTQGETTYYENFMNRVLNGLLTFVSTIKIK